jgi:hypothetical protein
LFIRRAALSAAFHAEVWKRNIAVGLPEQGNKEALLHEDFCCPARKQKSS